MLRDECGPGALREIIYDLLFRTHDSGTMDQGGRKGAGGRRRQKAEGRREKTESRRQKAGGRRQKAEGRRQKAGDDSTRCAREIEAGGTPAVPVFAFCGSSYELRHSTRCPLTLDFGHWILDLTRQNLNGFLIRLPVFFKNDVTRESFFGFTGSSLAMCNRSRASAGFVGLVELLVFTPLVVDSKCVETGTRSIERTRLRLMNVTTPSCRNHTPSFFSQTSSALIVAPLVSRMTTGARSVVVAERAITAPALKRAFAVNAFDVDAADEVELSSG